MSKHFEKGKKDARRFDDRDNYSDDHKKKKMKPIEKTKYRVKNNYDTDDGSEW